jgi:membrane protein
MLSFSLYVLGLVTGVVAIPLVVAGPGLVAKALPQRLDALNQLYWPTVVLMCVVFTATLYHVSVPVRTSWRYNLPGAALTLLIWIAGSAVLRWFLTESAGESTSIYGPLATPIAVMIWLYVLAIAVLIGAALNAAFDEVWPEVGPARARIELMRRLRSRARLVRRLRTRAAAEPVDALEEYAAGRDLSHEDTVLLRRHAQDDAGEAVAGAEEDDGDDAEHADRSGRVGEIPVPEKGDRRTFPA